jgi:glyoxylase-like metal-dependent hydrolase (beta-lactamase superfamily II)
MHRFRVGEVDVVRVEDLNFGLHTDDVIPDWFVPEYAPSSTEVGIAFSALAIADGDTTIVVDPWLANDGPRDQPDAASHAERLLDELAGAGFPADQVDIVVNTHLDGVGWNTRPDGDDWVPAFPKARYMYPADEVAAIERGEPLYGRDDYERLAKAVEIERIEGPLALTSSVSLEPAPGHNFGHMAVRIASGDDLGIYPGHLVLSPFHVDAPHAGEEGNPDRETTIATRRRLLGELADRDGLLFTTLLGGSGSGVVRRNGDGFALRPVDAV